MAVLAMAPAYAEGLSAIPSYTSPEGASQTFKKGALLIASAGNLVVAAADPAANTLVGMAEENGDNLAVGVGVVHYVPLHPNIVFEATLAAAAGADHTLVNANRWTKFGIDLLTGKFFVDQSDTVNVRCVIVGFRDGLINHARVYIKFLDAATIYGA